MALRVVSLDFLDTAPVRTSTAVRIGHPVPVVFTAVSDPSTWGNWFPGFAKGGHYLSGPPYGVGVTRAMKMGGTPVSETVLAWDEPNRWAFYVAKAFMPGIRAFAEDYRFSADGDATVLTWTLAVDLSPLAKPGAAVIGAGGKALMKRAGKNLERYLSA